MATAPNAAAPSARSNWLATGMAWDWPITARTIGDLRLAGFAMHSGIEGDSDSALKVESIDENPHSERSCQEGRPQTGICQALPDTLPQRHGAGALG
jgi:hypothetical protein